jgi:hypothetical protein
MARFPALLSKGVLTMTSKQFHALARQIFAHERATNDQGRREYWVGHFTKLINLVRQHNIYGRN